MVTGGVGWCRLVSGGVGWCRVRCGCLLTRRKRVNALVCVNMLEVCVCVGGFGMLAWFVAGSV